MVGNFSFVIKGRLAGAARPGWWGNLEGDLEELKRHGITALVTLTEEPLSLGGIRKSGLAYLHLPIGDFTAPTLEQIEQFHEFVERQLEAPNAAVAVHCLAGRGRTGTMLACYLVATDLDAETAIRTVRRLRPGSIETSEQEDIVHSFAAHWAERKRRQTEREKKAAKKKAEAEKPKKTCKTAKAASSKPATGKREAGKKPPPPERKKAGKKTEAKSKPAASPPLHPPAEPDLWEDVP